MNLESRKQNPLVEGTEINLAPLTVIRTETVLSKLPLHNLNKKGRVNIQITKTGPDGQVDLKWEVSYSDRYGQAGQLAYKLDTIIIDKAIEEAGRPLPERIRLGSLRDICEELGVSEGGRDLNSVKRAFRQNALAGITAKVKYKGNDGTERTLEATFTRYSVIFTGEKLSDGTKADGVFIEINPTYREVLNNAPVRPLDLDYKRQLTPCAQRFYEIVSYKMFTALKYKHPFARLAYSEYCMFSAQQRYFDYDHFKKQMYKVHRLHVASGYLSRTPHYQAATDADGQPDWMMFYSPGPKARAEYATFTGKRTRAESAVDAGLLAELTNRGVSETQARKVLFSLPPDFPTLDALEWGDRQIDAQPRKFTNPPGFYVSLLLDQTRPPATGTSSNVQKQREAAILEERQALEETRRQLSEEEADARLDELKASKPDHYRALFDQAKTQLFAEFPKLATLGRQDDSIHEGAIRARMKKAPANALSILASMEPV